MSAPIPVRTVGGQVLAVPPIRLNWVTERPELIRLIDLVGPLYAGGASPAPTAEVCRLLAGFLAEVVKACKYEGPAIDADVSDCFLILAALRGAAPDPTRPSPDGSGT